MRKTIVLLTILAVLVGLSFAPQAVWAKDRKIHKFFSFKEFLNELIVEVRQSAYTGEFYLFRFKNIPHSLNTNLVIMAIPSYEHQRSWILVFSGKKDFLMEIIDISKKGKITVPIKIIVQPANNLSYEELDKRIKKASENKIPLIFIANHYRITHNRNSIEQIIRRGLEILLTITGG